MNVHISYKSAKAPDVEREFAHHIQKLQRRLQIFRPDLVHLHGIVDQGSSRGDMSISLNLRLPSGQLAAQESGPTAVTALKGAFTELVKQLTKHKELLRGHHHRRTRKKPGNGHSRSVPFEETLAAVQLAIASDADVTSYLNANLPKLQRFIDRELRYRQNSGQLEPNLVSCDEVLDEVVANALGNDEQKPELLSLERWMYRLAMQAIGRVARGNQEQGSAGSVLHLETSARKRNVLASDEPGLQYHQPDETLLLESVIADRRVATPEEIASSDEIVALVESALLNARPEDREAFILFAVEGFTLQEISATTDRDANQVLASIYAARDHIKRTLHVPELFKERLLRQPKIA